MNTTSDDARAGEGLRLLRIETERLVERLQGLATADWDQPTSCDPWSVRQLVAHTVRGGESFLVSLERGLRGIFEPAFPPEYRTQRMNEIAAWEPDRIVSTMRAVDERFQHDLDALRPDRLGTRGHHVYGLMTARWFVDQRLAEIAVHRWDLERSLGQPAELDREVATHLLPMLFEENLPARLGQHVPPIGGRIRFVVSGAPGPSWSVDVSTGAGGTSTVQRGEAGPADLTVDGDPVALLLLLYGRRPLAELEDEGLLAVSGDRALADRFAEILPGP